MPPAPARVSIRHMRASYRATATRRALRAVAGVVTLLVVFALFAAVGAAMALAVANLR